MAGRRGLTTSARVIGFLLGLTVAVAAAWLTVRQSERDRFVAEQRTCLHAIIDALAETQHLDRYIGRWSDPSRVDALADQQRAWNTLSVDCDRFIEDDPIAEYKSFLASSIPITGALQEEYGRNILDAAYKWYSATADQVQQCQVMGWLPWQDAKFVHLEFSPA